MHLAFIDIAAAYHAETPFQAPLGGTQSAVCYLGTALVRQGFQVTFINQNRESGVWAGVGSLPPERLDDAETLKQFDALVFNGRTTAKLVTSLRKLTPVPFIMWMHEAAFNDPWILPLPAFSHFVFVSRWQERMNRSFLLPHQKSTVIANGIAPMFEDAVGEKTDRCVYVGSAKRGLFFLPPIIKAARAEFPALTFDIFSDGVVSMDAAENEKSRAAFAALDGVTHMGAVSQTILAQRLKAARYFVSPNPYPETFCISLAEAMAAGLQCITTARAALPETGAGFTTLVPVDDADNQNYAPEKVDVEKFIAAFLNLLRSRAPVNPAQITYAREYYNWSRAAALWAALW